MENTKRRATIFSTVLRVVCAGGLLFHLLLGAPNVKGQTSLRAGFSRSAYPPLAGVGGGSSTSKEDLLRKIYTSQIGVRERQTNSGPQVEKYLRYVNLPKGNPWCAAFVCWSLGKAEVSNPRTGWSPALFKNSYVIWEKGERGKLKGEIMGVLNKSDVIASAERQSISGLPAIYHPTRTSDSRPPTSDARRSAYPPRPITDYRLLITESSTIKTPLGNQSSPKMGDVFGLYFPEKGRIAHVGFVDKWQDPWVTTVEGNTNVLGSREGDGVYRKRRLVRSVYRVARYVE